MWRTVPKKGSEKFLNIKIWSTGEACPAPRLDPRGRKELRCLGLGSCRLGAEEGVAELSWLSEADRMLCIAHNKAMPGHNGSRWDDVQRYMNQLDEFSYAFVLADRGDAELYVLDGTRHSLALLEKATHQDILTVTVDVRILQSVK